MRLRPIIDPSGIEKPTASAEADRHPAQRSQDVDQGIPCLAHRFEFQRYHERPQPHSAPSALRDLLNATWAGGRVRRARLVSAAGDSDIYREQGERMIVVKFDIHNRDLAGAVAEAKQATEGLVHATCRLLGPANSKRWSRPNRECGSSSPWP